MLPDFFGNPVKLSQPVVSFAAPSTSADRFRKGIQQNETSVVQGDPYASSQYSGNPNLGNAMGAYRVTEGELKSYGQKFLGQPVTSQQFQTSRDLQDKYMNGKFNYYSNLGYTPQQIADIHNKGFTNAGTAGSTTYQNPDYVNKFNKTFLGK